jgi:hypothetical protein
LEIRTLVNRANSFQKESVDKEPIVASHMIRAALWEDLVALATKLILLHRRFQTSLDLVVEEIKIGHFASSSLMENVETVPTATFLTTLAVGTQVVGLATKMQLSAEVWDLLRHLVHSEVEQHPLPVHLEGDLDRLLLLVHLEEDQLRLRPPVHLGEVLDLLRLRHLVHSDSGVEQHQLPVHLEGGLDQLLLLVHSEEELREDQLRLPVRLGEVLDQLQLPVHFHLVATVGLERVLLGVVSVD